MDISVYIRFILALAGVLALIAIAAFILKRVGWGGMRTPRSAQKRLGISAAIALDGRRRLVLVRRDDVEHLLLVGGPADLVVETGIGARATPAPALAPIPGDRNLEPRFTNPPPSAS